MSQITIKAHQVQNTLNLIEGLHGFPINAEGVADKSRPVVILRGLKNEKGISEGYKKEFRKLSKALITELEDLQKREQEIRESEDKESQEAKLKELSEVDVNVEFTKLSFKPLEELSFDTEHGIDYTFLYDTFFE